MAKARTFADPMLAHCVSLLAGLGPVRPLRMFGGHGFYVDDLFMALLADGSLYLKADAESRDRFAAAGSEPFAFTTKGGLRTVLSYWRAPDEAMESPDAMRPWARLAMAAALRAANARPVSKPPAKRSVQPAPAAVARRRPRSSA